MVILDFFCIWISFLFTFFYHLRILVSSASILHTTEKNKTHGKPKANASALPVSA